MKYFASQNVSDNVGAIEGIEYQNNGAERIKGSAPFLVYKISEVLDYLRNDVFLKCEEHLQASRFCVRFFVCSNVLGNLDEIEGHDVGRMKSRVEAKINLGRIFEDVGSDIYWVWIGGNTKGRVTSEAIIGRMIEKMRKAQELEEVIEFNSLDDFKVVIFGSNERLRKIIKSEVPDGVELRIINRKYATQIAQLYRKRIPVNITNNSDPEYISAVLCNSEDSVLFAMVDVNLDTIMSVVCNEFCKYPVKIKGNKLKEVKVCESNDWVKDKEARSEVLQYLLNVSLRNAYLNNVAVIEAECVCESFKVATRCGFRASERLLLRTSRMLTDGENMELEDESIDEEYRKFNSLFLMYQTGKKEYQF